MDTGADAIEVIPKAHQLNPRLRSKDFIDSLCETGTLASELRVPDTIGNIDLEVNLRAARITLSTRLKAPDDRTARARVVWLVKQLKRAPETLLIDAYPKATKTPVTASLAELRDNPLACIGPDKKPPTRFHLRLHSQMGAGRVLIHPGFCAGSNDWSKYGGYETRYAAWADFAEVFAGAEGARGADGVRVA